MAIKHFSIFLFRPEKDYTLDVDIEDKDQNPDELKSLENEFYRDGFVPAIKVLSNIAKSLHDVKKNEANQDNQSTK